MPTTAIVGLLSYMTTGVPGAARTQRRRSSIVLLPSKIACETGLDRQQERAGVIHFADRDITRQTGRCLSVMDLWKRVLSSSLAYFAQSLQPDGTRESFPVFE